MHREVWDSAKYVAMVRLAQTAQVADVVRQRRTRHRDVAGAGLHHARGEHPLALTILDLRAFGGLLPVAQAAPRDVGPERRKGKGKRVLRLHDIGLPGPEAPSVLAAGILEFEIIVGDPGAGAATMSGQAVPPQSPADAVFWTLQQA